MENVVIEYNVTWYDKVSHENFTATFRTKKSAVEHATFVKSQNLGDDVFISEVTKRIKVIPEEEWLNG